MDPIIIYIIIGLVCLVIGIIAGKLIFAQNNRRIIEEAEFQSKKIIEDAKSNAENLKKEKLLEAKERFVQLKSEHDKEVFERNRKIGEGENRIRQKEQVQKQKNEKL